MRAAPSPASRTPAPPPASRREAQSARREPARREGPRYTVEVASASSVTGAAGTRERLRAGGFSSSPVVDGDDATVRVRLGSFPTRDAAESLARRLRDAGHQPTVLPAGG